MTGQGIGTEEGTKLIEKRFLDEEIYVFTCTLKGCSCQKKGMGISFFTCNLAEAEKHSRENDAPFWIAKQTRKEYTDDHLQIKFLEKEFLKRVEDPIYESDFKQPHKYPEAMSEKERPEGAKVMQP